MNVALDLDGTIADLRSALIRDMNYELSAFQQWVKADYEQFMADARHVWDDAHCYVPPTEPNIGLTVGELQSVVDTVDIVTNTAGSIDAVNAWLAKHDVEYNRLIHGVRSGRSKQSYDYDVYIDDKPGMAGTVPVQYMPNRPWNDTVRGGGDYMYHSLEPSYLDSEGIPTRQFETDATWLIRYDGLTDVVENIRYVRQ